MESRFALNVATRPGSAKYLFRRQVSVRYHHTRAFNLEFPNLDFLLLKTHDDDAFVVQVYDNGYREYA